MITLRRFVAADAKRVLAMLGDEGQRMLRPSTLSAVESWIENFPHDRFAILNAQKEVVGEVHLAVNDHDKCAELGYVTAKEYEGQGIATQAIRLTVAYGFAELKLNRIWARTSALNYGSIRALQKSGFVQEAKLVESRLIAGKPVDEFVFRLLRRELVA